MISPGEPLPSSEDGSSRSSPTPSAAPGKGKKLSSGAIAGIAVGGVAAAGLIGAVLFVLGRKSKILSRRRKDSPASRASELGHESGISQLDASKPTSGYGSYADPSKPMSEHGAYSPYGMAAPHSPPAELSSPEPDMNKHASVLSGETAYDDARWQTITPPLRQHASMHSELDATQQPQSPMFRDHLGIQQRLS